MDAIVEQGIKKWIDAIAGKGLSDLPAIGVKPQFLQESEAGAYGINGEIFFINSPNS
ncbi:hypothetical protein [Microcoleus sp. EPA2]|uniref:hypothetical protein n=1 Tax=Microcoleus sp. EPA2 TaxID=2841654 RepID=UPI00312B4649